MKKLLIHLFILLSFTISKTKSQEPFWEYLWAPNTGYMLNIEVDSRNNIFITSYNGIFRSTNNGLSWEHCLYYHYAPRLAISNNDIVFCGGWDKNKNSFSHFSTDYGESWIEWDRPRDISTYCMNFDQNNVMYSIGPSAKDSIYFFISTDLGKSWQKKYPIVNFEDKFYINDMNIEENGDIVFGGWFDINEKYKGEIFISTDKGDSWEKLTTLPGVKCWQFLSPNELFAGTGDGLFYTSDRGQTWDSTIFHKNTSAIFLSKEGDLYLSSGSVYFSSDLGKTWEYRQNGMSFIASNFNSDSNGTIFGGSVLGFSYTTNKGKEWIQSNDGFTAANIRDISFDKEGNVYAVDRGIHKSSDDGNTWECIGLQNQYLDNIIITETGTILVSGNGDIFRSSDKGKTWINLGLNYPSGISVSVDDFFINKRGHIFIGHCFTSLYRSTDDGVTWEYEDLDGFSAHCFAFNSEGHIFVGDRAGMIYRSTDDGDTWEKMSGYDNIHWEEIYYITFSPYSSVGYALCHSAKAPYMTPWDCFKTIDNGRTWTFYGYCGGVAVDSLGNFWDFTSRSTNNGDTWEKVELAINHTRFSTIAVSPNGYIYLSAEKGGLYRSVEKYVSVNKTPEHPKAITLQQNAPNPFEENTEISYYIDAPAYTRIKLYNMLGIEVAEYGSGFVAGGWHTFVVKGSGLTGGVYILRIESGGKAATKVIHKMR